MGDEAPRTKSTVQRSLLGFVVSHGPRKKPQQTSDASQPAAPGSAPGAGSSEAAAALSTADASPAAPKQPAAAQEQHAQAASVDAATQQQSQSQQAGENPQAPDGYATAGLPLPGATCSGRTDGGTGSGSGSSAEAAEPAAAADDAAPQAAPAAGEAAEASGGSGSDGLTAMERERLERIRRNQAVMRQMGLAGPGVGPRPQPGPKAAAARQPARKRPSAEAAGGGAVRRSSRNRGPLLGGGYTEEADTPAAKAAAEAAEEEGGGAQPAAELQYDDSSVRRYICEVLAAPDGGADGAAGGRGGEEPPAGARVSGFRQLPGCLHDPGLARAYSVDWRPGLVVAGGKDGLVSVWGSRRLEAGGLGAGDGEPPLLSGKLHKGWVSDVQLVGGPSADSSAAAGAEGLLLLTAGNDGSACLWDLSHAAEAGGGRGLLPQCLARATDLHRSGIFSLHELGGRVVTASKDGTVTVSSLGSSGGGGGGGSTLAAVQRYEELHEGVVKCARWRDGSVFGSCGNDRTIAVVDARAPLSSGPSLVLEGAHATAVNCLRWSPASEHLALSASHDPAILLHDLRAPAQPLHRFVGHAASAGRIGSIYQPTFCAGGDAIATSCERSTLLSLYCVRTGATVSRGDAGLTVGATFCGRRRGDPLLCTAARAVYLFQPTWHTSLHMLSL